MNRSKIRYKDELPVNTINRVRSILGSLGFLTVETRWRNSVEGFYSVSVEIANTDLATNGKGISYEYALASAYGGLMERLQNQCTFRLSLDLSNDALQYLDFYYAPDEVRMSTDEILSSTEDWLVKSLSNLADDVDKRDLLKLWQDISYEEISADFIALPYVNVCNKQISHIPIKMVSKMYMSNGMCAGNTCEEALVQGISEILERYVNKRIVREKIVPPSIPRNYVDSLPQIAAMVEKIEASGNFEVILKDCSLNQELPVVGIIFINKDDQTYFVKFGAHPVFEIAIERTLTELLQGQNIHKMMGVREFSYKSETYLNETNLLSIFVNGSGEYPCEFFGENYSYEFKEFTDVSGMSNKDMLNYFLKMLAARGDDVFVRNVSYLDFPSYHIIIPGLSEIEEIDDWDSLHEYAQYNKIRKLIRSQAAVSPTEARDIINFLGQFSHSANASVLDFLNISVKNGPEIPWYYASLDLFITALFYQMGDFKNAYSQFIKFLYKNEANAQEQGTLSYYRCVRDYIGTRIDGLDVMTAANILSRFYPLNIIQGVIAEFSNNKIITSYLGQLSCWECEKCPLQRQCKYCETERIYKVLKEQMIKNPINQVMLSDLCNA